MQFFKDAGKIIVVDKIENTKHQFRMFYFHPLHAKHAATKGPKINAICALAEGNKEILCVWMEKRMQKDFYFHVSEVSFKSSNNCVLTQPINQSFFLLQSNLGPLPENSCVGSSRQCGTMLRTGLGTQDTPSTGYFQTSSSLQSQTKPTG